MCRFKARVSAISVSLFRGSARFILVKIGCVDVAALHEVMAACSSGCSVGMSVLFCLW